ncbi:predicted protein [Paecilomyces variotii No. 5]|uniref:Uncharacterized protein n=1 Tax=Byssochlamys spectabilis (strain No. 5 / NBRC 109023) TaxID=1356009 RepID=V5HTR5_BYSSN|nr:predicted protein [Paecilomyces variotii No. 5]
MENEISLLYYLTDCPPPIPTLPDASSQDHAPPYIPGNLPNLTEWTDFDLLTILDDYELLLRHTLLHQTPFPESPPPVMMAESHFQYRFAEHVVPRVRRALRATFDYLEQHHGLRGRTVVSFDSGAYAGFAGAHEPELSFYAVGNSDSSRHRIPGVMKPSWEWDSSFAQDPNHQEAYRAGLATLNWYMRHRAARYGFMLTDKELMAVRRMETGDLQLSASILWRTWATSENPELTMFLGLWYLGILASYDNRWNMQGQVPEISHDDQPLFPSANSAL